MLFEVEFVVRTSPKGSRRHEIIETFQAQAEANSFGMAREKVFAALKQAPSLEAFMDTLIVEQKGNG